MERSYFEAIEATFVRLRGAPLLLSPADWQLARSWWERKIPLDLVLRTMEEVFERRRDRGAADRVNGLRYCADAVLAAWRETEEMLASGARAEAASPGPGIPERLQALAGRLPADLPRRETWVELIHGCAREGDPERVEAALGRVEARLLRVAERSLSDADRRELEATASAAVGALERDVGAAARTRAKDLLRAEGLREALQLPRLSLYGD